MSVYIFVLVLLIIACVVCLVGLYESDDYVQDFLLSICLLGSLYGIIITILALFGIV